MWINFPQTFQFDITFYLHVQLTYIGMYCVFSRRYVSNEIYNLMNDLRHKGASQSTFCKQFHLDVISSKVRTFKRVYTQ